MTNNGFFLKRNPTNNRENRIKISFLINLPVLFKTGKSLLPIFLTFLNH